MKIAAIIFFLLGLIPLWLGILTVRQITLSDPFAIVAQGILIVILAALTTMIVWIKGLQCWYDIPN